jgi:hypothetical protein
MLGYLNHYLGHISVDHLVFFILFYSCIFCPLWLIDCQRTVIVADKI